jgi:hypothetical protein
MILAFRLAEYMLRNEIRKGSKLFYLGAESSVANLFATRFRGQKVAGK